MKSEKVVCVCRRVVSTAMVTMGMSRSFMGRRKKDVEQGRRQAEGKEIKENQIHLITGLAASAAGLVVLSP